MMREEINWKAKAVTIAVRSDSQDYNFYYDGVFVMCIAGLGAPYMRDILLIMNTVYGHGFSDGYNKANSSVKHALGSVL